VAASRPKAFAIVPSGFGKAIAKLRLTLPPVACCRGVTMSRVILNQAPMNAGYSL
jgi:hypothetical protein